MGLLVLGGGIGHLKFQDYLGQAMHINPLMRNRIPTYLGYSTFGSSEEMYYSELNDLNSLREMVLYEEVVVEEPLTYLGTNGYSHYFERENGDLFRHSRGISFHEGRDKATLIGGRFVLKDESFIEIGFKNPEHAMFSEIVLPANEEGKEYKPENEMDFLRMSKVLMDWNI